MRVPHCLNGLRVLYDLAPETKTEGVAEQRCFGFKFRPILVVILATVRL
jgi:hypothetical protein